MASTSRHAFVFLDYHCVGRSSLSCGVPLRRRVKSEDSAEQARALDILFSAYWKPVYKYVRLRWNRPAEDAQDLTQGFFTEMLERELLAKYEPAKSKLRTYLRLCMDSFVMNQEKAARRQKRGGNAKLVA